MKEAEQLRAWLAREGPTTVGGVGMAGETLVAVLDRLDELEWIVGVMRGKITPAAPQGFVRGIIKLTSDL